MVVFDMKKLKVIIVGLFISILVIPLASFLLSDKTSKMDETKDIAQFPSSFNNHYFDQIASWFTDHSPFREQIINGFSNFSNNVETWYFNLLYSLVYGNQTYPMGEEMFSWDNLIKDPYLDKGQPYYPAKEQGQVIFGRENWLFYSGENSLNDYKGVNILSIDQMESSVRSLTLVQEACKKKGINFAVIVLPNKEQVYADKMPTYPIRERKKKLLRFREYAKAQSNLPFVYPLEELIHGRAHSKNTYLMQDTHWNNYGAMIGYEALCNVLGMDKPVYTIKEETKVGGGTANMLGITGEEYVTNTIEYKTNISVTYNQIDYWTTKSTSNCGNERKCVIAGDSFSGYWHYIIGCDYSEVFKTHFKEDCYSSLVPAINALKPGDTLIMEAVERQFDGLVKASERIASAINSIDI